MANRPQSTPGQKAPAPLPAPEPSALPFEVRHSPIQGMGAFATRYIPPGVRLIEYAGERLTPAEAEARWINHSCDPNCDAVIDDGRIWIETIRDIVTGEELAYDYAYILEERHTPAAKKRFPCHCGAESCRGTILAKKR